MRVLESILYNNLNASLQRHHNPEITDIKEHICGGPKKIEESRRLYSDLSVLQRDLAESVSIEYDIHECVLDNGNVMFATKMYHKGIPFMSVPFKKDGDMEPSFVMPENILKPYGPSTVVPSLEISNHVEKSVDVESEEYKQNREMFKVLKGIDVDTPIRYMDTDNYMNYLSKKVAPEEMPPNTLADDSNIGMAVVQKNGNMETLRYTTALGKLSMAPLNVDDGSELLMCINESFRVFEVFEELGKDDILEEYFICNKNALSRHIPTMQIQEAVDRDIEKMEDDEGREKIKATKISNSTSPLDDNNPAYDAMPKKTSKRVRGIAQAARKLIAKVKRANDDELREKLYNDEFIPLVDDFFEVITSGTVTAVAWTVLNPIMAILMGILTFILANWKQRLDRRRIKELMDDTINKLEEEIEDARSDGDLAKKRRLGEAKRMLERRRAKIAVGQSIAAR